MNNQVPSILINVALEKYLHTQMLPDSHFWSLFLTCLIKTWTYIRFVSPTAYHCLPNFLGLISADTCWLGYVSLEHHIVHILSARNTLIERKHQYFHYLGVWMFLKSYTSKSSHDFDSLHLAWSQKEYPRRYGLLDNIMYETLKTWLSNITSLSSVNDKLFSKIVSNKFLHFPSCFLKDLPFCLYLFLSNKPLLHTDTILVKSSEDFINFFSWLWTWSLHFHASYNNYVYTIFYHRESINGHVAYWKPVMMDTNYLGQLEFVWILLRTNHEYEIVYMWFRFYFEWRIYLHNLSLIKVLSSSTCLSEIVVEFNSNFPVPPSRRGPPCQTWSKVFFSSRF